MADPYPPSLLAAIRRSAERYGVPAEVLIATTLVEAPDPVRGVRLNAVGDGGHSIGPFQENDQGRGHGLSAAARMDPQGSADRAAREFAAYQRRGLSGGALAAAAQRPADPVGYRAKVDAQLPQARRILAGVGGVGGSGTPDPRPGLTGAIGTREPNPTIIDRAGGAISDAVLGPVNAAIAFVKDFAFKVVAFILLGVIGVWLVSQGASKAFGTPTVGQIAKSAPVPIPV